MNKQCKDFLTSLTSQLYNFSSYGEFITTETFLNGTRFSFSGHEFQEYIVRLIENNPGCTFSITKSSQLGLSEFSYRTVLAAMAVKPGTSALLSMPSKQFSQEVLRTRVTPIIDDSPRLSSLINKNVDSASVKQFHNGSILYALSGSKSSNSNLLNRPISLALLDEIDKQDPDILTGFRSRMTHTLPEKRLVIKISTPTAAGIGIDAEFSESREQHTAMVECEHCQYRFEPDFYVHVKIPGYNKDIKLLTKSELAMLDVQQSYLECPECFGNIVKRKTYWDVTENPQGLQKTIGIKLNPFIAPAFISIPDLVEASQLFSSSVEFLNQGLGKVANLRDSSVQREHIHFEHRPLEVAMNVFGLDLGKLCHFMKGRLNADTTLHVDEAHVVKLAELEDFLKEQFSRTVFMAGVIDSQPYTDLVYRLVKHYPRLYSAIYVSPGTPIPELFKLKMTDKHGELVRQVSINKAPMMDLMANSLESFITFEPSPMEGIIVKHLLDMRRVRDYRFEEMIYQWIKSKTGEDHFFHTLTYFFTASKLAQANLVSDVQIPIGIHKMRMKR